MRAVVWDLPTRLFHWSLALAVGYCLFTGFGEDADLEGHMRAGQVALTLVVFRVLWGLFGATYARFGQFLRSPRTVWRYLRTFRSAPTAPGHNPAGGWAVVLLLAAIGTQATSGLFTTDDIWSEGPLVHLADSATVSLATAVHHRASWVVAVLVGLHVLALVAHRVLRKEALVAAMVHGRQEAATTPTRWHWAALCGAGAAAGAVAYAINTA